MKKLKDKNYIYIAGPMRGKKDYNFPAFNAAAETLRAWGFAVINPAAMSRMYCREKHISLDTLANNRRYLDDLMRRELCAVVECDAIFLLDGWRESIGAYREFCVFCASRVGVGLNREIYYESYDGHKPKVHQSVALDSHAGW